MRGVCQQRHFPSVARPFRILWAPWAPAVFFFGLSFVLAGLGAAIFGGSAGPIVLVIGIMGGHFAAVMIGSKAQYAASIVTGIENRRTGTTNLSSESAGNYEFSNI